MKQIFITALSIILFTVLCSCTSNTQPHTHSKETDIISNTVVNEPVTIEYINDTDIPMMDDVIDGVTYRKLDFTPSGPIYYFNLGIHEHIAKGYFASYCSIIDDIEGWEEIHRESNTQRIIFMFEKEEQNLTVMFCRSSEAKQYVAVVNPF